MLVIIIVLWLCVIMLVLLQDAIEEDQGFPMHHSTLTEITTIKIYRYSPLIAIKSKRQTYLCGWRRHEVVQTVTKCFYTNTEYLCYFFLAFMESLGTCGDEHSSCTQIYVKREQISVYWSWVMLVVLQSMIEEHQSQQSNATLHMKQDINSIENQTLEHQSISDLDVELDTDIDLDVRTCITLSIACL